MIALLMSVSLTLLAIFLLAGGPGWAKDEAPAKTDWAPFDAEAERGFAAYDAGDYDTAKAILLPLAERGHPKAIIAMASMDDTEGQEHLRWMSMAAINVSRYALVDLWLSGYREKAWHMGMTIGDFVCVSWHVLILDGGFAICD